MLNERNYVLRRLLLLFSILSLFCLLLPFTAYSEQACPTGQTKCGAVCVNLQSDSQNCGTCGTVCPAVANGMPVCTRGSCGFACSSGWANCDGNKANGCEANLNTDPRNCGTCGTVCSSGATCVSGRCQQACPTGQTKCGAVCVNLQSDPQNCGTCGSVCPVVANGTPICARGSCGFACSSGWANCDGNKANGCEANLNTDPRNCGTCGTVCSSGATCSNGKCVTASATGTRINLQVERQNCGPCGAQCAVGYACIYVNGVCVLSCH
jgi:Stigma-specific protein, Stig1